MSKGNPVNPLKTLTQMLKYHRSIDVEKALRWQYSIGYKAGQRDAMKHLPRPYEPQTDPLQNVPACPPVIQQPRGAFFQQVRSQSGHNTESQILKVVGNTQLAQLKAKMQEKEGQK